MPSKLALSLPARASYEHVAVAFGVNVSVQAERRGLCPSKAPFNANQA